MKSSEPFSCIRFTMSPLYAALSRDWRLKRRFGAKLESRMVRGSGPSFPPNLLPPQRRTRSEFRLPRRKARQTRHSKTIEQASYVQYRFQNLHRLQHKSLPMELVVSDMEGSWRR